MPKTERQRILETFPNPEPQRDYALYIRSPEFSCLCPRTGQPDFATLFLCYVPDRLCVELKSLKMYIFSYRDQGAYHEAVTNTIANDLIERLDPRYLHLAADFHVRGGINTRVVAEHRRDTWQGRVPPLPCCGDGESNGPWKIYK